MAKCILIVDDEEIVVEISKRKLQDQGFDVMTAGDGLEALEALKQRKPDLILLDIQMPKMNGYTFVMEKNKNPDYASIPVIILTAYGEMEPILQRHGIKAYLLKPLKLQELIETVKSAVG